MKAHTYKHTHTYYYQRSYNNTLMHLATARDEGFKSAIKLVSEISQMYNVLCNGVRLQY